MIKKRKRDFFIVVLILLGVSSILISSTAMTNLESLKDFLSSKQITGHGTVGKVNLTITQNLTLNVVQEVINFSTGYVDTGQAGAILNTSATGYWISASVPNWTNTSDYDPSPLQLRNDGNVNASVNITSGKDAAAFIGGTSPLYQFNGSQAEANSCKADGTLADYTSLTTLGQLLCANLGTKETEDDLYVHCLLWVPSDAIGTKEDQWTFTASANLTG